MLWWLVTVVGDGSHTSSTFHISEHELHAKNFSVNYNHLLLLLFLFHFHHSLSRIHFAQKQMVSWWTSMVEGLNWKLGNSSCPLPMVSGLKWQTIPLKSRQHAPIFISLVNAIMRWMNNKERCRQAVGTYFEWCYCATQNNHNHYHHRQYFLSLLHFVFLAEVSSDLAIIRKANNNNDDEDDSLLHSQVRRPHE